MGQLATQNPTVPITRFDAIAADIEILSQAPISFDYESKEGAKDATSYIRECRGIRAKLEAARKEEKADLLTRGRQIDSTAKQLDGQILAVIEPHQKALDAIKEKEEQRIAAHRATINWMLRFDDPAAAGSSVMEVAEDWKDKAAIRTHIDWMGSIHFDQMEEFEDEAMLILGQVTDRLLARLDVLHDEELTALKEAERLELERLAALRDAELANQAQMEQLKAEEAERLAREEAYHQNMERLQRDAAEAQQVAAKEREARVAAEAKAMALRDFSQELALGAQAAQETAAAVVPAATKPSPWPREEMEQDAADRQRLQAMGRPNWSPQEVLFEQLMIRLQKFPTRQKVVRAIVEGELHPAVTVRWGIVTEEG